MSTARASIRLSICSVIWEDISMRGGGVVKKTEIFSRNFVKVAVTYDYPVLSKVDLLTERIDSPM